MVSGLHHNKYVNKTKCYLQMIGSKPSQLWVSSSTNHHVSQSVSPSFRLFVTSHILTFCHIYSMLWSGWINGSINTYMWVEPQLYSSSWRGSIPFQVGHPQENLSAKDQSFLDLMFDDFVSYSNQIGKFVYKWKREVVEKLGDPLETELTHARKTSNYHANVIYVCTIPYVPCL